MGSRDQEFQKKLFATFRVEARDHVGALTGGLVSLEKASGIGEQEGILETLIREAHSLKGAARAVNVKDIEGVCQALESVFAALKRRQLSPSPKLYDVLHGTGDGLSSLIVIGEDEQSTTQRLPVADIIGSLEGLLKGEPAEESESPTVSRREVSQASALTLPAETETVRVSTAKLDAVLRRVEELFGTRLAAGSQVAELREIHCKLSAWKKEWAAYCLSLGTIERSRTGSGGYADQGNGQELKKLLGFIEESRNHIGSTEAAAADLVKAAERSQQSMSVMVDELLEDMKKVLMQPFSTILDVFPKHIRNLSRDQGKEADLAIRGAEIEIDRRILEEMKDPLIHLVRNCVDHGVETPDERSRKGKQPRGTITLAVSQRNGSNVELLVVDDGAGINSVKVKEAAVRLGIISPEEAKNLGDGEALPLIFHSGVSTSPMITDVSGRGLGLAIAQEKVEKLGGRISVETRPGGGTIFRIVLPLTLATFRGVIVRTDRHLFAFPTAGVERVVQVNREDIRTVENRETFTLGGQAVPLVRLQEILEIPGNTPAAEPTGKLPAIVLASAEKRIAILVDEIIDEQEVLVKHLGSQLRQVRNIAGATVLGTGKIVPVLNVPDLMRSAVRVSETGPKPAAALVEEKPVRKKSVLVVEDSITSRMLLKNILETAGYEVGIAVDGIDAFTKLRSGGYDIAVSDVQMPRMNGFDMTAKIRADRKLGEMPVVLVTALESREDRERGIEVGANAYIVKSSFDQSNLLEVVRRLL